MENHSDRMLQQNKNMADFFNLILGSSLIIILLCCYIYCIFLTFKIFNEMGTRAGLYLFFSFAILLAFLFIYIFYFFGFLPVFGIQTNLILDLKYIKLFSEPLVLIYQTFSVLDSIIIFLFCALIVLVISTIFSYLMNIRFLKMTSNHNDEIYRFDRELKRLRQECDENHELQSKLNKCIQDHNETKLKVQQYVNFYKTHKDSENLAESYKLEIKDLKTKLERKEQQIQRLKRSKNSS
jgi:hypothetical protein